MTVFCITTGVTASLRQFHLTVASVVFAALPFPASRGPRVLAQCVTVIVRIVQFVFKEFSQNYCHWIAVTLFITRRLFIDPTVRVQQQLSDKVMTLQLHILCSYLDFRIRYFLLQFSAMFPRVLPDNQSCSITKHQSLFTKFLKSLSFYINLLAPEFYI
jgi:nitrate reductase gamma subunit